MSDDDAHGARAARREMIEDLGDAYLAALMIGEVRSAEIAVREAMDARLSAVEIHDGIIAPALSVLEELWQRGQIPAESEHLATEISIRVLALQREAWRVAQARREQRVILAAAPGDRAIVALRMMGDLLRDGGYDVVMLGAEVPSDALIASARRHTPAAICMSVTLPGGFERAVQAIDAVRTQFPEIGSVLAGAGLVGELASRPDIRVSQRLSEVVEAVDAAVMHAALN